MPFSQHDDKQLIHSKTCDIHVRGLNNRLQYSFGIWFVGSRANCFVVIIGSEHFTGERPFNHQALPHQTPLEHHIQLVFLSFVHRSKPSTHVSFVIWSAKSLDMPHTRSAAWNCWRFPRTSVHWSSARLVWAHTSAERGSVKNCPTFSQQCVRPVTLSKRSVHQWLIDANWYGIWKKGKIKRIFI